MRGVLALPLVAVLACAGEGAPIDAPDAPDAAETDAADIDAAEVDAADLDAADLDAADLDAADIDAGPPGSCETPVATLSSFPITYTGTTVGADANMDTVFGECPNMFIGWSSAAARDDVVALTALTPGTRYALTLSGPGADVIYTASACDATGPADGSCLEVSYSRYSTFIAPATGIAYVIVDGRAGTAAGPYTLHVEAIECQFDVDCTAAEPVCDTATHTCISAVTTCAGDTTGENDNGPVLALDLGAPTAGAPVVVSREICSGTGGDDWYRFTVTTPTTVSALFWWTDGAVDLDASFYDQGGYWILQSITNQPTYEAQQRLFPAGTYYMRIVKATPQPGVATPYTLRFGIADCASDFGCTNPAAPTCARETFCMPSLNACTGDVGEPDNGPTLAHDLTGVVGATSSVTSAACSMPGTERDWYAVTVATPGESLVISLSWPGAPATSFFLGVYDAAGQLMGDAYWHQPKTINLTYLPAGTYYIYVIRGGSPERPAAPYTLTARRIAATACTGVLSCASSYQHQAFRGECRADGACAFIAAGTRAPGTLCDSGDDCGSGYCSYWRYSSNAQRSVCTFGCAAAADCASLGAGFTCDVNFTQRCRAACSIDHDCGALPPQSWVPSGPWNYPRCIGGGVCEL